ncbi:uncharacterized protein BDW43DRAFT_297402 [Aspergillus alliaceus]|uniref:uncharacterized protein n=1 Tax=Petromyces alliaceus TaxID=209559 RepID=UPI0012A77913|nr:Asx homology domain-containing protein [Aspergillus alliaceus]KAB8237727.1 Asx homology domain-containing protein [Aspergillus alliaceus]
MSSTSTTQPKRNPKRAAKDPWAEDKLMTSTSSQLINLDLVKLLAQPEAWNCLDESEKKEVLDLLPEDLHPNPDPTPDDPNAKIPPLPESFLRYSNNWRDGIRHFQLDLQNGRYDPVWLRQADEAMQQRADGKFDKFKEEEFEQFWGQKQKMDKTLVAGQSSQVKLSTLLEHGAILTGDVWKYSRAFAKGKAKLLVEKEARIVGIQNGQLTFEFPPGQRVFLPAAQNSVTKDSVLDKGEAGIPQIDIVTTTGTDLNGAAETNVDTTALDTNATVEAGSSTRRKSEIEMEPHTKEYGKARKVHTVEDIEQDDQVNSSTGFTRSTKLAVEVYNAHLAEEESTPSVMVQIITTENHGQSLASSSAQPPETAEDVFSQPSTVEGTSEEPGLIIVPNITGPGALAKKILEADGRTEKPPHGNAWKDFRAYRNNQDMGSLWEVRQAWFLRNK